MASSLHRLWHSRGYLPHFDAARAIQSITFRLWDSLPRHVLHDLQQQRQVLSKPEVLERVEKQLDLGHGSCLLKRHDVGSIVENSLLAGDGRGYHLFAWTIMPNHVHVLAELVQGHSMSTTVQGWKGGSAFAINRLLGRKGSFWMPDYFDRYVRDAEHFDNVLAYIEFNPVSAGLCKRPEEWRLGSAGKRTVLNVGD